MKDDLGTRMKERYENRSQILLPRRTYAILRLDGKAFHTFTASMQKPFDGCIVQVMDITAQVLCDEIQGAQFAYSQSDEISVLLTDFTVAKTDAWFDYNIQKITSIAGSLATAAFNANLMALLGQYAKWALFDARVFVIPDPVEVSNYFVWRQKDWIRNSIQMLAQSLYSHKELHEKNCQDMHEMIHQKGQNWAKLPDRLKNGGFVVRNEERKWQIIPAWVFTQDRERLAKLIPVPGYSMEDINEDSADIQ